MDNHGSVTGKRPTELTAPELAQHMNMCSWYLIKFLLAPLDASPHPSRMSRGGLRGTWLRRVGLPLSTADLALDFSLQSIDSIGYGGRGPLLPRGIKHSSNSQAKVTMLRHVKRSQKF